MKKTARILSLLLCVVMLLSAVSLNVFATNPHGFDKFEYVNDFAEDTFSDVDRTDWYYDSVKSAYRYGLMVGKGDADFGADESITVAEAVTIAARINSIFRTGRENFNTDSTPWYETYVDYARSYQIIKGTYDFDEKATRADFAVIFANALPEEAYEEINTVPNNTIPDVSINAAYGEAVYKLYRAGVTTGVDTKGTFAPKNTIKRSEVAAIVTRMIDPSLRESIKLGEEFTVTFVNTITGHKYYQRVLEGECAIKPEIPLQYDYYFAGWTTANSRQVFDFDTPITDDIVLYTKWTYAIPSVYKVVFLYNYAGAPSNNWVYPYYALCSRGHNYYNCTCVGGFKPYYYNYVCPKGHSIYTCNCVNYNYPLYVCQKHYPLTCTCTDGYYFPYYVCPNGHNIYTCNCVSGFYPAYTYPYYFSYGVYNVQYVKQNSWVNIPAAPTRDGYTFGGWYTTPNCRDGEEFNPLYLVNRDIYLYAKWVPVTSN